MPLARAIVRVSPEAVRSAVMGPLEIEGMAAPPVAERPVTVLRAVTSASARALADREMEEVATPLTTTFRERAAGLGSQLMVLVGRDSD